jgi:hypothetical protein
VLTTFTLLYGIPVLTTFAVRWVRVRPGGGPYVRTRVVIT